MRRSGELGSPPLTCRRAWGILTVSVLLHQGTGRLIYGEGDFGKGGEGHMWHMYWNCLTVRPLMLDSHAESIISLGSRPWRFSQVSRSVIKKLLVCHSHARQVWAEVTVIDPSVKFQDWLLESLEHYWIERWIGCCYGRLNALSLLHNYLLISK